MYQLFFPKLYSLIRRLPGLALLPAVFCISCKKENKPEPPEFGTCQEVTAKGRLTKGTTNGSFIYRTSGGGTITISAIGLIEITHDNYVGFKLDFWGGDANPAGKHSASHENMNGKHIKDRIATRRTVIFPDGAKITFAAPPPFQPLTFISIYDGAEVHRINPICNVIEYSTIDAAIAQQLDEAEEDGETSTFEFTATGLLWVNIYTEDTPGNKVMNRILLGEIFKNNPNQVNDHYDDLRLGHT